ncbi:hypothetical protein CDAR_43501 [Caerostris darwini]|uniref:Uncharacterized protein n=1 Tax=Caerostris darwini TaxID=1538125 RepID=A0AAV4WIW3_9ARAC|nr:hypothetical protein CDAR_43501 [Caerostris darwini]
MGYIWVLNSTSMGSEQYIYGLSMGSEQYIYGLSMGSEQYIYSSLSRGHHPCGSENGDGSDPWWLTMEMLSVMGCVNEPVEREHC